MHGTAGAPIVITADPGVWIDAGSTTSGFGALDILYVDHVHAVGVNVRNAQFGIRCLQCHGSAGNPVRFASNTVTQIGHSGIVFAGHWSTHAPSTYGLIENNVISNTGVSAAAYGEGIYLGHGSTEWVDVTSDVVVRGNDISWTGAEGVDVKPGTRNIEVRDNYIHDLAPINGGAISAHYVNAIANPHPSQLDSVLVQGNRIWNLNLSSTSGSNDWAIWVGHGGVDVLNNVIWGLRDNATSTRAVRVRATQDFGPHPIRIEGNTFWTTKGWMAEGSPSGASNVVASSNRGTDASTSETVVDASAFVGPVPALGASGSADSGGGPGSGFALASSSTTTAIIPATTTTTVLLSTTSPTTTAPTPSTTIPAPTTSTPTTSVPATTVVPSTAPTSSSSPSTTAAPTTTVASDPPRSTTTTAPTTTTNPGFVPTSTTEPSVTDEDHHGSSSLDDPDPADLDLALGGDLLQEPPWWMGPGLVASQDQVRFEESLDWPGSDLDSAGSDQASTGADPEPGKVDASAGEIRTDGDETEVLAFDPEAEEGPSGPSPIGILAGLAVIGVAWVGSKWRVSGIG